MATGGKHDGPHAPFLAFTIDSESAATLKQFARAHGWSDEVVRQGDIAAAVEFLKTNPSPHVLCVDVHSVQAAPAQLNALADVCDPTIKVIASGTINEYSFFCWLTEVGISGYLLKPFTLASLEAGYLKATESHTHAAAPQAKKEADIIAVIGSRGGVGATTVSVNIAWLLANKFQQKTALLDFDPQLGTTALALDLEPAKGMRDVLEKPERIDGLFLDRVMVKVDDYFSILNTEESLDDVITPGAEAAEAILTQVRTKYSHLVIDLPRTFTPFTRAVLKQANKVICVTEYSIAGLRESLRYLEHIRDTLKMPAPLFVANRIGIAGKHQMPQEEFEKGLGVKVVHHIPFVLDAYGMAVTGEVLSDKHPGTPAAKALLILASQLVPGKEIKTNPTLMSKMSALVKGGK